MPVTSPAAHPSTRTQWLAPAGLVALAAVPIAAGTVRHTTLINGGPVTPSSARFFDQPAPVVAHILSVTVFCFVGAFQFVPTLRRHAWHRRSGRIVAPAGIIAAGTGLWMSVYYQQPPENNTALEIIRLAVGFAMIACLLRAVVEVRRRRYTQHRGWMMRGYALGLGAGTQVFTTIPWVLIAGQPTAVPRAFLMGLGWAINLAVAEWLIRVRPTATPAVRATSGDWESEPASATAPLAPLRLEPS